MQNELLSIVDGVIGETQAFIALAKELATYGENLEECFKELKASIETKEETHKKTYTMVNVREALAEKSAKGYSKEVKAILEKYGADKLSTLSPDFYEKVIEDAKDLGNE